MYYGPVTNKQFVVKFLTVTKKRHDLYPFSHWHCHCFFSFSFETFDPPTEPQPNLLGYFDPLLQKSNKKKSRAFPPPRHEHIMQP